MQGATSEAQVHQCSLSEDVSTGRSPEIMLAHIFATLHRSFKRNGNILAFLVGELEQHDVGILVSHDVKAMLKGGLYQIVVCIHKLDIQTRRDTDARIACRRQSLVGLTDINNVIIVFLQGLDRTHLTTIVDDYNLSFRRSQRQCHDTVNTLAEHVNVDIIKGNDETYFFRLINEWSILFNLHSRLIPKMCSNLSFNVE